MFPFLRNVIAFSSCALLLSTSASAMTLRDGDVLAAGCNTNFEGVQFGEVGALHVGTYSILNDYTSSPYDLPFGVAISPSGTILVSESEDVAIFDRTGRRVGVLFPGSWPSIAFDAHGDIFLAGAGNVIRKIDSTGNILATLAVPAVTQIADVDLASDQCTMFFTTNWPVRIGRYDVCAGQLLPDVPATLHETMLGKIRIATDGTLFVAGYTAVYHLSSSGTLLAQYTVPTNLPYAVGGLSLGIAPGTLWINFFLIDTATGNILEPDRSTRRSPILSTAVLNGPRATTSPAAIPMFAGSVLVALLGILLFSGLTVFKR